jgi:3-phosphoshikimate 1-carboxyvinyltransferase
VSATSAPSPDVLVVEGPRPLRGTLRLPGEKGMSHRALLFGGIAEGTTRLRHLAPGDDVRRTLDALRSLGVTVATASDATASGETLLHGRGVDTLRAPDGPIDCGNSGTTLRMLAGLLAGRPFASELTGDASLCSRPMGRVIEPLGALGARIHATEGQRAPLRLEGTALHGASVQLPVASGQVKTAVVLAALQADGTTEITEPTVSRDHTERMLVALRAPVTRVNDVHLRVTRGAPDAFELTLPGDPSSAAFLVVAASITPGSELRLTDVLLNPGRVAFVDDLRSMGADIDVVPAGERLGEPVGDLVVRAAALHGAELVCREPTIDEVPALAVAAAFAEGSTSFRGTAELRVKESDRVATVMSMLAAFGVLSEAADDLLTVEGGTPRAGAPAATGDHRIALAAAVAANAVTGRSTIAGWSAADVSYPGFTVDLDRLAA